MQSTSNKAKQQQKVGYGVQPRMNCPHLKSQWIDTFLQTLDLLGQSIFPGTCKDCGDKNQNWICLVCSIVYCSRYVNGHMAQHNDQTKHQIAFSFSDGSFWCYLCDDYITTMKLNLARNKFAKIKFPNGEDQQQMQKLTKQLKQNLNITQKKKFTYDSFIQGLSSKTFKKVLFMTGAGISVSAGIPDFRTPGTGLYSKLQQYNLPKPQAVFQIQYFKSKPEAFYQLSKQFFGAKVTHTIAHTFQKKMNDEGLLLKVLTQNIDGLQLSAGLPQQKLFQAHGHNRSAHCIKCKKSVNIQKMNEAIQNQVILKCQSCQSLVKPDIVFFGQSLPNQFEKCPLLCEEADLVIIMGTSLVVFPFAFLVQMVDQNTPMILINNTNSIGNRKNSLWLDGNIDDQIKKIMHDLKWET